MKKILCLFCTGFVLSFSTFSCATTTQSVKNLSVLGDSLKNASSIINGQISDNKTDRKIISALSDAQDITEPVVHDAVAEAVQAAFVLPKQTPSEENIEEPISQDEGFFISTERPVVSVTKATTAEPEEPVLASLTSTKVEPETKPSATAVTATEKAPASVSSTEPKVEKTSVEPTSPETTYAVYSSKTAADSTTSSETKPAETKPATAPVSSKEAAAVKSTEEAKPAAADKTEAPASTKTEKVTVGPSTETKPAASTAKATDTKPAASVDTASKTSAAKSTEATVTSPSASKTTTTVPSATKSTASAPSSTAVPSSTAKGSTAAPKSSTETPSATTVAKKKQTTESDSTEKAKSENTDKSKSADSKTSAQNQKTQSSSKKKAATPSRSVTIGMSQYLDITYPGNGWIYLGETDDKSLMRYFGRKLGDEDTSFTMRSREQGTTILHFYKNDPLTGTFLDDYLEVVITAEQMDGTRATAPEYAAIIPGEPSIYATMTKPYPEGEFVTIEPEVVELPPLNPVSVAQTEAADSENTAVTEDESTETAATENNPADTDKTQTTESSGKEETAKSETKTDTKAEETTPAQTSTVEPDEKVTTVIQNTSDEEDDYLSYTTSEPARPTDGSLDAVIGSTSTIIENEISSYTTDELLKMAKQAYKQKKYDQALNYLHEFFNTSVTRIDEGLFLQGQILEANSSVRNIKGALDSYETLVKNYPASSDWQAANERIIYINRFYFNKR